MADRAAGAGPLVDQFSLPLPDAAVDRVLLVHALEMCDDPEGLLREAWRVLSPSGRMIAVIPNRRGVWTRTDNTPFGHGRPYSRSQITQLLRQTWFTPASWGEALFMPPVANSWFLRSAMAWERVGEALSMPFAGVHVVEATKQVYRALPVHRERGRLIPSLQPVLVPASSAPRGRLERIEAHATSPTAPTKVIQSGSLAQNAGIFSCPLPFPPRPDRSPRHARDRGRAACHGCRRHPLQGAHRRTARDHGQGDECGRCLHPIEMPKRPGGMVPRQTQRRRLLGACARAGGEFRQCQCLHRQDRAAGHDLDGVDCRQGGGVQDQMRCFSPPPA